MSIKACDILTNYQVFIIRNKIDDEVYIGICTQDLRMALSVKFHMSVNPRYLHNKLSQHIRKLGKDNFYIECLHKTCDPLEAKKVAEEYIKFFNSHQAGLNHNGRVKIPTVAYCSGGSKLSGTQVKKIRKLLATCKKTQREIAKQFKVTQSTICGIKRGRAWNHLELQETDVSKSRKRKHDWNLIKKLYDRGWSQREIAEKLNTTQSCISRIMKKNQMAIRRIDYQKIRELHDQGLTYTKITQVMKISYNTVWRVIKKFRFHPSENA